MLFLLGTVLTAGALLWARRHGARRALPLTALVGLALAALLGPGLALAPLMGLVAALQVERGESYGRVLAAAAAPAAALAVWLVLAAPGALPREEMVRQVSEQLRAMGMEMQESRGLEELIAQVLRVQPGIEFCSLLLSLVLAYRLSGWLAWRAGVELPPARPMHLWRPWEELIWVLIAALALGLLADGLLTDLALNLLLVTGLLYAVQGLSVLRFMALLRGIPGAVELLFYMGLVFVAGLAALFLAGLGLLDTWFDWRRLRSAPPPEEGDGTA